MLVHAGGWGSINVWQALADLGCFLLAVPESAGGLGAGAVEAGILARAVGRHLLIEPVRENVVAAMLLAVGEDAGDRLAALTAGNKRYGLAFASCEQPMRTIRGAWEADGVLVAVDDGLLLADRATLSVRPVPLLDDTIAGDVEVASGGFRQIASGADWPALRQRAAALLRLMLVSETLGTIDAALDGTIAYVRERSQFGGPISAFQTVQHRVAEMVVAAREAEAVTLLATLTFDAAGPGAAFDRAIAGAVRRVAHAAELVADSGVQLHGGMGVSDETKIAAQFRKLQAFRPQAGGTDDAALAMVSSGMHRQSAVLVEG